MTKNEKGELLDLLQEEINRAQRKAMDLYNESQHWHGRLRQVECLRAALAKTIETEDSKHLLKACGTCGNPTYAGCRNALVNDQQPCWTPKRSS